MAVHNPYLEGERRAPVRRTIRTAGAFLLALLLLVQGGLLLARARLAFSDADTFAGAVLSDGAAAFSRLAENDGVTVRVSAAEGVFPDGVVLVLADVPEASMAEVNAALARIREPQGGLAATYSFDLKMMDESGVAVQPAQAQNVTLSFSLPEAARQDLQARVYHISGEEATLSVQELDTQTSDGAVVVETDGFSYYTVEFTYRELQYILPGDSSTPLADILACVGLSGTVESVEVSDSMLFFASKAGGEWTVAALRPFTSQEWLKVTLDGEEYVIDVTDSISPVQTVSGSSVTWEIDDAGTLILRPANGVSGELNNLAGSNMNEQAGNKWPWYSLRGQITSIRVEGTIVPYDSDNNLQLRGLFFGMPNLTSVDLSGFDLSTLSVANDMFQNCSSLTSVDLSCLGNSALQQANRMFKGCTNLTAITMNGVTLNNEATVNDMLTGCSSLKTLEITNSTLPGSMTQYLFKGRGTLETVNLSGTTLTVYGESSIFSTSGIKTLNLTGAGTAPSGADVSSLFSGMPGLERLNISGFLNSSGNPLVIGTLPVNTTIVSDGTAWVQRVSGGDWTLDGSPVDYTDINNSLGGAAGQLPAGVYVKTGQGSLIDQGTFGNGVSWDIAADGRLKIYPTNGVSGTINVSINNKSGWPWHLYRGQITGVTIEPGVIAGTDQMLDMFADCTSLTDVDVSGLDISKQYNNLSGMFEGCSSLRELHLQFADNTGKSSNTTLNRMFRYCSSLRTLDLSGASEYMSLLNNTNILEGCNSLTTLDLSGIAASNVRLGLDSLSKLKHLIAVNSNITFQSGDKSFGIGVWEKDNNGTRVPAESVLVSNKLPAGSWAWLQNFASGFENVQPSFYIINDLSGYVLEVNGQTYTKDAPELSGDDNEDYYVVKNDGNSKISIYTPLKSASDWTSQGTDYTYAPGSFLRVTYPNAARDVNGALHDVIVTIDSITFKDVDRVNYTTAGCRRELLTITPERLKFSNYVRTKDLGTHLSNSSGTYIDATIQISDAVPNQSFLFFVDDLDVAARTVFGSSTTYGPGSEGIILGAGFDRDTLTLSDTTKLETYTWVDANNDGVRDKTEWVKASDAGSPHTVIDPSFGYGEYVVGTEEDSGTYRTRFYVNGAATGSKLTWTSGTGCDTDILGVQTVSVWQPLRPLYLQFSAQKSLVGANLSSPYYSNGRFIFKLEPDSSHPAPDNLALGSAPMTAHNSGSSVTFGDMKFDKIGTYWYKLYEQIGSNSNIDYDSTPRSLMIQITGAQDDDDMAYGYRARAWLDAVEIPLSGFAASGGVATSTPAVFNGTGSAPYVHSVNTTDAEGNPLSNLPLSASAIFVNRMLTKSLTISKEVSGALASRDRYFPFTITLQLPTGAGDNRAFPVSGLDPSKTVNENPYNSGAQQLSTAADGTTVPASILLSESSPTTYIFWLQHGQSFVISSLPKGVRYTVTETDSANHTVKTIVTGDTVTEDGSVSEESILPGISISDSSMNADTRVTFTNRLETPPPTGIYDSAAPALISAGLLALILALRQAGSRRGRHE